MAKADLTAQRARELLIYEPETGVLRRRVSWGSAKAGAQTGAFGNGYLSVGVDNRTYGAHRLAWLITHGAWPTGEIDHINGDKADNRLANLRDVSPSVNMHNRRKANRDNKAGMLGVSRIGKNGRRWFARLVVDKKTLYLGSFDTPERAHQAYLHAKRIHHAGCTI